MAINDQVVQIEILLEKIQAIIETGIRQMQLNLQMSIALHFPNLQCKNPKKIPTKNPFHQPIHLVLISFPLLTTKCLTNSLNFGDEK